MAKKKNRVERSARLRATLRVAKLMGFKYDIVRYPFGGFLNTYQLEQIADALIEIKVK